MEENKKIIAVEADAETCWGVNPLFDYALRETILRNDYYNDKIMIIGNRDFNGCNDDLYKSIERIIDEDLWSSCFYYDKNCNEEDKADEVEIYFNVHDKEKIERLIPLCEKYFDDKESINDNDFIIEAINILTGKKWKETYLNGSSQSEWVKALISEEITPEEKSYIEDCYFENGTYYNIFESEEDYKNDETSYTHFSTSYDKKGLSEELNVNPDDLEVHEIERYIQVPQYKKVW